MKIFYGLMAAVVVGSLLGCGSSGTPQSAGEPHRPQVHFTPAEKWMNDPNGMVYFNNQYHLFYQYYPDSTVWGPMHWAHATSKDLVHWEHQPVALYPDSLGWIFSGSAVADVNNTSGFGKDGKTPLVAIFTHHNSPMEKTGSSVFQYQSLAYSLDEGKTWEKYAANPVLKNPGIRDFRDPKVMWYEAGKKWIMTLATMDRITFYSSPDLKNWTKESEFGKEIGAHGGVWECPDLFSMEHDGKQVWVLIVSINPGGPNGGSATQYFTGDFDGTTFTPHNTDIKWIDYGPDNYAGITWANTGDRKVFIGWMNNWQYANVVPTEKWRGAATLPRELRMEKVGEQYYVASSLVKELDVLNEKKTTLEDIDATDYDLDDKFGKLSGPAKLDLEASSAASFTITLSNSKGEKLLIGYDKEANQYFIDRTLSGKVSFEKGFAARHIAPRISKEAGMNMSLVIDDASVELLADDGLTVMTAVFFPNDRYTEMQINSPEKSVLKKLVFTPLKNIH